MYANNQDTKFITVIQYWWDEGFGMPTAIVLVMVKHMVFCGQCSAIPLCV